MKFKLNKFFKDDIENKNHPSDFEFKDNIGVLILRLPYIKNDKVEVVSYAFLIKEDKIYKYDRKLEDFELLGGFDKLYEYLDVRIDKILAKIVKLHSIIAEVEDEMYEEKLDKSFPKTYLKLKKDLVLIERLMGHALIALERFCKHYKDKIDELEFQDLIEHVSRAFSLSKNGIDKLDYLYDFYRARVDEKMNNIMFVLTLLSGIFLPLTLVTGFFGMNTGGLPLVNDPYGTIKAVIIGIALEIPIVYIVWKMMKN
ncbi:magnesium transporter CorA family protein [Caminibacter sp.]